MAEAGSDKPRRRWMVPLLLVSLALNLLVAGIVVGWAVSPAGRWHREMGPTRGVLGAPFVRALPAEARRQMMRDLVAERGRIRDSRESLRARFEAFLVALRANPYDPEAVRELLAEQREVALGRQEIGEGLLLKRLVAMTGAERAEYADNLEAALSRFTRR